jgi:hypothetical protein
MNLVCLIDFHEPLAHNPLVKRATKAGSQVAKPGCVDWRSDLQRLEILSFPERGWLEVSA